MRAASMWRRAVIVFAAAGVLAAGSSFLPVSAHDAGAEHDWNQHLLPLAKESFFTKKQSRARFLEPCEPGTIGAGARVDPSELPGTSAVNVLDLPSGRAFTCLGDGIFVRRDGPGEYFWIVDNEVTSAEALTVTPVVVGDDVIATVSPAIGIPTGAVTFVMTTYRITDDGTGAQMSKFEPPVIGILMALLLP